MKAYAHAQESPHHWDFPFGHCNNYRKAFSVYSVFNFFKANVKELLKQKYQKQWADNLIDWSCF